MCVQVNYNDGINNVDVKIKDADRMETAPVRELIWESEGAYVESRSFDSEVELVYGECQQQTTLQQNNDQLYVQVMHELDYWSDCIAISRSQEEDYLKGIVTTWRHKGPPEVLFIPTARLLNTTNKKDQHFARAVRKPERSCVPPEWMFLSKATYLSRATTY